MTQYQDQNLKGTCLSEVITVITLNDSLSLTMGKSSLTFTGKNQKFI